MGTAHKNRDYFNIKNAHHYFTLALIDDDDIHIGSYLDAYKELCKFCTLLGSVFSFVATEIVTKSDIMHKLRENCLDDHFDSLQKMILHEKDSELLKKDGYVSGCRTFLRLHRGLDFIRTFLRRILTLDLDGSTREVGSKSYCETLGQYHGWLIRQGAFVAMKFLPSKRKLLDSVCGHQNEDVDEFLPLMLEAADEVYKRTEHWYETHDLLDLP